MKKKLIISLFCIAIVLIAIGIILYNWKKVVKDEPVNSKINIEQMVDDCYKSYQKDVAAGMNLYMDREMCYINVAEELRDYKVCLIVKNNDIKNQCLRTVAEKVNDVSVCDMVVEGENSCYFEVALNLKDLSICQKINDESDSYDGGIDKSSCYYHMAKTKNDISICEKIMNDPALKGSCIQNAKSELK